MDGVVYDPQIAGESTRPWSLRLDFGENAPVRSRLAQSRVRVSADLWSGRQRLVGRDRGSTRAASLLQSESTHMAQHPVEAAARAPRDSGCMGLVGCPAVLHPDVVE